MVTLVGGVCADDHLRCSNPCDLPWASDCTSMYVFETATVECAPDRPSRAGAAWRPTPGPPSVPAPWCQGTALPRVPLRATPHTAPGGARAASRARRRTFGRRCGVPGGRGRHAAAPPRRRGLALLIMFRRAWGLQPKGRRDRHRKARASWWHRQRAPAGRWGIVTAGRERGRARACCDPVRRLSGMLRPV